MMSPPGGDVVARVGLIAGIFPTFIDFRVRSESGLRDHRRSHQRPRRGPAGEARIDLLGGARRAQPTTPNAALPWRSSSKAAPPPQHARRARNELPFFTNPTRCGVPLERRRQRLQLGRTGASKPEGEVKTTFPEITGCDHLPFGPRLEVEPTNHHTSAPTGLDMTIKLPASPGVKVLEPSQMRYMRIDLPEGMAVNTGAADGLGDLLRRRRSTSDRTSPPTAPTPPSSPPPNSRSRCSNAS